MHLEAPRRSKLMEVADEPAERHDVDDVSSDAT